MKNSIIEMNYFAYGSNMSLRRLSNRITNVDVVGTHILYRHKLRFHKISDTDGSAKCDLSYTGRETDLVYGVLYRIENVAKQILDKIEGLGKGYNEKHVTLVSAENHSVKEAVTYYATNTNPSLLPYNWYLKHVLIGAREAGVPKKYLNGLNKIKTIQDSDKSRQKKELAIYQ